MGSRIHGNGGGQRYGPLRTAWTGYRPAPTVASPYCSAKRRSPFVLETRGISLWKGAGRRWRFPFPSTFGFLLSQE